MVGATLGHFKILARLAESASGEVYRAEDEALRRPVVLKILSPALASDPEHKARFLRAARAAALVTHPHVAAVHEVGESEGRVWVAMEKVEGPSLRSRLAGRPLPLLDTLRIGEQVAEGLAAAHEKNLAHGNLSAEKVVLGPGGQVKVVDLGLGDGDSGEEGSQAYDARTDVYRLGAMLYEMATGRPPATTDAEGGDADAFSAARSVPPSLLDPEIPAELDRILGACLEPDPEDRYQTTGQVAVDLGKLRRRTESASVAVASGAAAARPEARRRPARRWRWAAVSLALAAGLGVAGWQWVWPRLQPAPPFKAGDRYIVADFVNETSDIELGLALRDALDSGLASEVTLRRVRRDTSKEVAALDRAGTEARCLKGECEAYVTGRIAGDQDRYRLEIAVYHAGRSEPVVALSADTDAKTIGKALDGMMGDAARILHRKSGIGRSSRGPGCDTEAGDANSLKARLQINRGVDLISTAPEQALAAFKRARELDPTAPAYCWDVGWWLSNLGRRREALPYLKEAVREWSAAAEKQPACRERELTFEIWYLDWTWNYDLLAERVNRGIQLFPNNGGIWQKYAEITERVMGNPAAALPHYRKMYQVFHPIGLDVLLMALLRAGELGELDAVIAERRRDSERIDPESGDAIGVGVAYTNTKIARAQIHEAYLRGEDYGFIVERIERSIKEGQFSEEFARSLRAQYLACAGRLAEAEKWAREAQKGEETAAAMSGGPISARGYTLLDWLEKRRTGKVRDLEAGERDGYLQSDLALNDLAHKSVDLGTARSLGEVLQTVEEEQKDNQNRLVLDAIRFSRGSRALVEGRAEEAVGLLEPLGRDYAPGSFLSPQHVLGRAYGAAGRWADAAKAYESVVAKRTWNGNDVVLVLDQHRLAGIYERLGNTERARYWYGRFLDDWRNADPGTPEVEDAKRRLAALGPR
jgi:tetratricopeptide (TPR) repeat protein